MKESRNEKVRALEVSEQEFRRLAEEVVGLSAKYLAELDKLPTFPKTSGAESEQVFGGELPETGTREATLKELRHVVELARATNGRFYGYVLSPGEPVAALGDLLASILNQNVTAWRSTPSAVAIERTVVGWLAEAVGCAGFSGSLTGGGSPANLMALAMAREAKLRANERGLFGMARSVIYASEQVHMAVPKAVAMLGLGRDSLRYIGCDEAYRMRTDELSHAIREDVAGGRTPIAVVASAGTVATGAIDPLHEVAGIAREHGLWMHVDGAYGALAAIAAPEKFRGLAEADSLSLDPHKWLYQPIDCGCLLFRDAAVARQTFAYTGSYAKQLSDDPIEHFAFFEESMELSRRFRGLKLWLSLRYHGLEAFRAAIRRDLEHAQRLACAVDAESALERMAPAELSAVCFRHRVREGATEEERGRFNLALLKRVQARGRVYLSNAELQGKFCLRACIVNHLTKESDIDAVVPEVLTVANVVRD